MHEQFISAFCSRPPDTHPSDASATATLTVTKTLPPQIQTYVTAFQNDKGTPELEKDLPPMMQAFTGPMGKVLAKILR